jgi:hypothetical protein
MPGSDQSRRPFVREPLASYTHIQNARAERAIRICKEHVRWLLRSANLPRRFWPDALRHFCRLYAYWPDANGLSPWEKLDSLQPHQLRHNLVKDLNVFGSYVMGHLPRENPHLAATTHDDHAEEGVFLGNDLSTPNFWMSDIRAMHAADGHEDDNVRSQAASKLRASGELPAPSAVDFIMMASRATEWYSVPQSNADKESTRKRLEAFVQETRASETVAKAIALVHSNDIRKIRNRCIGKSQKRLSQHQSLFGKRLICQKGIQITGVWPCATPDSSPFGSRQKPRSGKDCGIRVSSRNGMAQTF